LYGIIASLLLLVARFGSTAISLFKSEIKKDKVLISTMLPRGLAAAVLASLPFSSGIQGTDFFLDIAFIVIIGTTFVALIGTVITKKMASK
jgi:cell volume regulation protein A